MEAEFQTESGRSFGRSISHNPKWKHVPNNGRERKKEDRPGFITRTCKMCGKTFTLPESVQHWPDYCQECRAKYRPVEMLTRTCRGCGRQFTFPSSAKRWPRYCQECQAKRMKRTNK